ncbi:hypothetical protein XENTR_v10000781 [Xenopus tropicalis]|nr:hypothetical protein XENTR_v10000781 [Xenopus tropicalis]
MNTCRTSNSCCHSYERCLITILTSAQYYMSMSNSHSFLSYRRRTPIHSLIHSLIHFSDPWLCMTLSFRGSQQRISAVWLNYTQYKTLILPWCA